MFKVGQKVVCVDAKPRFSYSIMAKVKEGEIYTVKDLRRCMCGDDLIYIGTPSINSNTTCRCNKCFANNGKGFFGAWRFRPIDHAFGHQIASEIEEEINQEQLVKV
jgi:hypothetical protein